MCYWQILKYTIKRKGWRRIKLILKWLTSNKSSQHLTIFKPHNLNIPSPTQHTAHIHRNNTNNHELQINFRSIFLEPTTLSIKEFWSHTVHNGIFINVFIKLTYIREWLIISQKLISRKNTIAILYPISDHINREKILFWNYNK